MTGIETNLPGSVEGGPNSMSGGPCRWQNLSRSGSTWQRDARDLTFHLEQSGSLHHPESILKEVFSARAYLSGPGIGMDGRRSDPGWRSTWLHGNIGGAAGRVALIAADDREVTVDQLLETIRRAGDSLSALSRTPVRILSLLNDSPAAAVALLALCDFATAVPANPALTQIEIERMILAVGADAILTEPDRAGMLELSERLGLGLIHLSARESSHPADFDLECIYPARRSETSDPEIAIVLPTSGSTGNPKLVPLRRSSLLESARNIADVLRLGPDDTAVHMLPVFHIGAVTDLLIAPLLSGGRVRFAHPASADNVKAAVRASQATWFQVVPTMLYGLLANSTDDELYELGRSLRFVRSVSADLSPKVQELAEARLGGVPIIQMYGMTETAGQITSNPLPPAQRKPGSVGLPAGPEVAIIDRYGNAIPRGRVGEVCVRGTTLTAGYENTDISSQFHGQWLRTGDLGYLDEDGYLFLAGREKDMINRGGEKIAPSEIEQPLFLHPSVSEAAAFAIPHPTLGEEVGVAVVVRQGSAADEQALREHLMQHLALFKLPRKIWFLDAMPRLGTGKINRNSLKQLAGRDGAKAASQAPKTELGRTIAQVWADTLDTALPGVDDDFFDVGGDSLAAASFLTRLEQELKISIPANMLYESPRLGQLEQSLQVLLPEPVEEQLPRHIFDAVKAANTSWAGARPHAQSLLVARNTAAQKAPFFFCMQGRQHFEDLVSAFRGERPIYLMRSLSKLRTRARQPLKSQANNRHLVRHYAREIAEIQPNGPILLGGFCQGASIARAIADELMAKGRDIGLLVIFDRHFREPCPYPAALVWSTTTEHSPAVSFYHPERALDFLFPQGATSLRIDASHDDILLADSARRIVEFLSPRLDAAAQLQTERAAAHSASSEAEKRRAAYGVRIVASVGRLAAADERLVVRATVTNNSPMPWRATSESGLFLGARWLRGKIPPNLRKIHAPLAGKADFPRTLQPGASITLELTVAFPRIRSPHILLLDLVDDGLCWAHELGHRPWQRYVLPRYWRFGRVGS